MIDDVELEKLTCVYCKNEFRKARKFAKYCSTKCNSAAYYDGYRQRGYETMKPKPDKIKERHVVVVETCPICQCSFRKTRSDKMTCSAKCTNRLNYLRSKGNTELSEGKQFNRKISGVEDIGEHLKYWKFKCFMLNESDLFRVIDVYDRLFPSKYMADGILREEQFEIMIQDIIFWYQKNKNRVA